MPLSRRARGWLLSLLGVLALGLLAAWWVARMLEPERLTPVLLARAERALGLQLELAEPADYALRPGLRLGLSGLQARLPGAAAPVFTAERIDLALPWTTLLGEEAMVTRLELIAPAFDLPAMRAWMATRPPAQEVTELPRLTAGLRIERGRVREQDWTLDSLEVRLPRLLPGEPVELDAAATLTLGDGPALPWRLRLAGHLEPGPALTGLSLDFDGASPLPTLSAAGALGLGVPFALELDGELKSWPAGWPALPVPLSQSDSPLPFSLALRGEDPMSSPLALTLARDQSRFEGRAVPQRLLDWIDAEPAPLLPPLNGVLTAPRLEIGGVLMEGVRVELDDGEAAQAPRP